MSCWHDIHQPALSGQRSSYSFTLINFFPEFFPRHEVRQLLLLDSELLAGFGISAGIPAILLIGEPANSTESNTLSVGYNVRHHGQDRIDDSSGFPDEPP